MVWLTIVILYMTISFWKGNEIEFSFQGNIVDLGIVQQRKCDSSSPSIERVDETHFNRRTFYKILCCKELMELVWMVLALTFSQSSICINCRNAHGTTFVPNMRHVFAPIALHILLNIQSFYNWLLKSDLPLLVMWVLLL